MKQNKLKELQDARKRVQRLEEEIARERAQKLKTAHLDYGFETREELIAALKGVGESKARAAGSNGKAAKPRGRKNRGRITPEMKEQVKTLAGEGKTGAAIAREVGISLPSVQNIKKELGLVRARK